MTWDVAMRWQEFVETTFSRASALFFFAKFPRLLMESLAYLNKPKEVKRDDLATMCREIVLSSGVRNCETDDSPVSFSEHYILKEGRDHV